MSDVRVCFGVNSGSAMSAAELQAAGAGGGGGGGASPEVVAASKARSSVVQARLLAATQRAHQSLLVAEADAASASGPSAPAPASALTASPGMRRNELLLSKLKAVEAKLRDGESAGPVGVGAPGGAAALSPPASSAGGGGGGGGGGAAGLASPSGSATPAPGDAAPIITVDAAPLPVASGAAAAAAAAADDSDTPRSAPFDAAGVARSDPSFSGHGAVPDHPTNQQLADKKKLYLLI